MTTPPARPAPPQNDPAPLGYAAAPGRRRRWVRRVAFWTLLPVVVLVLLRWGFVPLQKKYTFLHHQSRCMRFAAAPGTVAYTEDPATVARLTGGAFSGPGWATLSHNGKPVAYYLAPPSLRRVEQSPGVDIPQGSGPVFLHARAAAAGGGERLVVAKLDPWRSHRAFLNGSDLPDHVLNVSVVRPAGLRAGPSVTRTLWNPDNAAPPFGELTIFAGQPDPNDASHFTIDYQTPAGRGTIEGWLQGDDTVKLIVRDGPMTYPPPPAAAPYNPAR